MKQMEELASDESPESKNSESHENEAPVSADLLADEVFV